MSVANPWVLAALLLLPALWWLLRASPPAVREQVFPAMALLLGLITEEQTPARTPWWLLALRLAAAAAIIIGLAGPVLQPAGPGFPAAGPLLLAIDDGWAAAADWPARQAAADALLARAERARRPVRLLTTAPASDGAPPHLGAVLDAAALRPILAALRPLAWPVDRAAAVAALHGAADGPVAYVDDGVDTPDRAAFAQRLAALGPVEDVRGTPHALLLGVHPAGERLVASLRVLPATAARDLAVLGRGEDGTVLTRRTLTIAAGATAGEAVFTLPAELRNRLGRLTVEDGDAAIAAAGAVALLDEGARRHPVGLVGGGGGDETPLTGPLYYLERALAPLAELRTGDVPALLARPLSVLVLTGPVPPEAATQLADWVRGGGLLLRFAAPGLSDATDETLLPVPLLAGDRQLGGTMSWSAPQHLAAFADTSPFAGLQVPGDVTVSRQVLAEPSPLLDASTWARLADGTPLVTAAALGAGRVVLIHVPPTADWSNLPLSGLFPRLLERLLRLGAGVAATGPDRPLAPLLALDGAGVLGQPGAAALAVPSGALATTIASPRHPPGYYGTGGATAQDRRALNLATGIAALAPAPLVPGATAASLDAVQRARPLGAALIALALALLAIDMLASLRLRGLLARPHLAAALAVLLLAAPAYAQNAPGQDPIGHDPFGQDPSGQEISGQTPIGQEETSPALSTHLAYVASGDEALDRVARQGLAGLSEIVNRRTSVHLAAPAAVIPGQDELAFYPLLYWPVSADTAASPAALAALDAYMAHGGLLLIDTRGGGEADAGGDAGFGDAGAETLRRFGNALHVPPLTPLGIEHVLSRSFYLLRDYPGRVVGDPVWVARENHDDDSVSPVVVGANDWAAAWAVDADGQTPYAAVPGGAEQRERAYRFGVNLVMYALTGNYKRDQVHVDTILRRLGQ